jgi:hypothetical protein
MANRTPSRTSRPPDDHERQHSPFQFGDGTSAREAATMERLNPRFPARHGQRRDCRHHRKRRDPVKRKHTSYTAQQKASRHRVAGNPGRDAGQDLAITNPLITKKGRPRRHPSGSDCEVGRVSLRAARPAAIRARAARRPPLQPIRATAECWR